MSRYIAEFQPQAWINDFAVDVDPQGDTEWEPAQVPAYLREALDRGVTGLGTLDRHDELKTDPNAPQWVRDWRGPFEIYIRRED